MRYADSACEFNERYEGGKQSYDVTGPCLKCGKKTTVTIPAEALYKYQQGEYIQRAMWMLSPGQREFLISGYCEPCFDAMFAEEEDDHDVAGNGDV